LPDPSGAQPPYPLRLAPARPPIRVVVADDHAPYRYAVGAVLGADDRLEVVGTAPDGLGALNLVRELSPHVALVDVMMAPVNGFDVCRTLASSSTGVILLSAHDDSELVARGRSSGAAGYLSKNLSNEALKRAVVVVAGGGTCFAA
jgi:DNA-binding NarL/FixJ family response regulator